MVLLAIGNFPWPSLHRENATVFSDAYKRDDMSRNYTAELPLKPEIYEPNNYKLTFEWQLHYAIKLTMVIKIAQSVNNTIIH